MRSFRSFVAIACLLAHAWPLAAQQPAGPPAPGPISRALSREAARIVASGEFAASVGTAAQAGGTARLVELRWNELAPLVTGQRVEMTLPDGRVVNGEAVAVRDDAILVDARTNPKGGTLIPRTEVTRLTLRRTTGSVGRNLGVALGLIGGLYLGGLAAFAADADNGGSAALFFGITIASSVGGYYLGKRADTHTMYIRIVP